MTPRGRLARTSTTPPTLLQHFMFDQVFPRPGVSRAAVLDFPSFLALRIAVDVVVSHRVGLHGVCFLSTKDHHMGPARTLPRFQWMPKLAVHASKALPPRTPRLDPSQRASPPLSIATRNENDVLGHHPCLPIARWEGGWMRCAHGMNVRRGCGRLKGKEKPWSRNGCVGKARPRYRCMAEK